MKIIRRALIGLAVLAHAVVLLAACTSSAVAATSAVTKKPVFAIYYMWWSQKHWQDKLGPNYPYAAVPQPLPATLDSDSCGTQNLYAGNTITDVSQGLAYDHDNPATIEADVRLAASLGLSGFAVNWKGEGNTTQSPTSSAFNRRLQSMFDAVHKVNAEGIPFKLVLNYQSSAVTLALDYFVNDLNYFISTYGFDGALDHAYSTKPEVILAGTWKYGDDFLATLSATFRSRFLLIGDEKPASWNANRAASLDGASYYWSSQNPFTNTASFTQLQKFAATIRSTSNPDGSAKLWFAPFSPGYNAMLLYGTTNCVPRRSGAALKALYEGNASTNPDGWTLISWNEISEGSYIVPLTRYGTFYTTALKQLIKGSAGSLWDSKATPALIDAGKLSSTELGVRFRAGVNGQINGIRFYKSAANTGPHIVSLWNSQGRLIAQTTVAAETASGWQQVEFSTPVNVVANTTYVASYHAPVGHFSATRQYFATSDYVNGDLRALRLGGVYRHSSTPQFPNQTFEASNYWVDVIFVAAP